MELSFDMSRFEISQKESEEYGEIVGLTSKLLKRPYMTVHKIFEKEQWSMNKIQERYQTCTKHNGNIPSDVLWWYLRKKDKSSIVSEQ